jgi:hypothetical protein
MERYCSTRQSLQRAVAPTEEEEEEEEEEEVWLTLDMTLFCENVFEIRCDHTLH